MAARLADAVGRRAGGQRVAGLEGAEAGAVGEPLAAGAVAPDRGLDLAAEAIADLLGAAHVVRDRDQDREALAQLLARSARARRPRSAAAAAAGRSGRSRAPARRANEATSLPNSPGCHSGWRAVQRQRPSASCSGAGATARQYNRSNGLSGLRRTVAQSRRCPVTPPVAPRMSRRGRPAPPSRPRIFATYALGLRIRRDAHAARPRRPRPRCRPRAPAEPSAKRRSRSRIRCAWASIAAGASKGSVSPSAAAVPGMNWAIPSAPAGLRASGSKPDST